MTAKKFRRRAEICMQFAGRVSDPDMALRLRLMAGEYLVKAEEEESQMVSGGDGLIDAPLTPSPNPEPSVR